MLAAVIPSYVIALCNAANIILALYFFPAIVEWLDDKYWEFNHRSWFIEYEPECEREAILPKNHINYSKESILMLKSEVYERTLTRNDVVNYNGKEDDHTEEYLRFRENQKMLQSAADDGMLIKKQNFIYRVRQRIIEHIVQ
ncbi:unnamed protein product [Caenorhabditis sp. 36 PRJEB53466]|nr:unnamed protein product [Caenorhabditis sp. 36 PRJEB53466]